jgi:uncharacterized protein (TIGR02118 family)
VTVAYFATFHQPDSIGGDDLDRLTRLVAATPGLSRGLIHTPARTHDPYLDDGRPPELVLQLYFAGMDQLQAALAPDGHLQALGTAETMPSLRGAAVTQQAMLTRTFPVRDAVSPAAQRCTYLVTYEGAAEDPAAWIAHYVEHHTAIMARFPGIREIEVCTPIDWHGSLPWPRADAMLRNKVVFDDADALTAALNSPIRHEMRADFQRFPAFHGRVTHFPMVTVAA